MKDGIETYFFSWHGFAQLRYKFWHAILAWTFVIQLCLALGVREQRIVKHLHKKEGNLRAAASQGLVSFSFKSSIDVGRQAPHAGNWQSSPKKTIDGRPKHFSGAKTRMLLTAYLSGFWTLSISYRSRWGGQTDGYGVDVFSLAGSLLRSRRRSGDHAWRVF